MSSTPDPTLDQTRSQKGIALQERSVDELLAGIGSYTVCVNEPPWSRIAPRVPRPARVVEAWDMDINHLESLLAAEPDSQTVVGIGGGSAMDTAKFIAWKTGKRLVQVPSITSVDAAFTDAVGVRIDRKVKYIGQVFAEFVTLDIDLVRTAPPRLNRAGIGDILSCYTGLWDWQFAVVNGQGAPWDDAGAALGRTLLQELAEHVDAVCKVTPDAVRWLASAYQRIGTACTRLHHSRFEEGSEHFLGYSFEHVSGAHPLHGELIAMCVLAMSTLQREADRALPPRQLTALPYDASWAREMIVRSGVRAHPADIGMTREQFIASVLALPDYVAHEALDYSVINRGGIDEGVAALLWDVVSSLPRVA